MKNNLKALGMLLSISILSLLTACGGGMQMNSNDPIAYKTMKVAVKEKTVDSKYSATIKGRQDVAVMPQVTGKLEQLLVTEGQKVKKGQPMFIIDQVPYQAAVNTAKANLEAALASEATAKLNAESNVTLYNEGVVSEFTKQTTHNTYMQAKAAVAQARAALINAQNSLSYTVVKSPSNGVVGTLPYRVGAYVSPNMQTPLTTVSDNQQMYVYFSMTENQLLSMIRKAGSADAAVEAMPAITLQLVDGSLYDIKGKVETISGVVDQTTGSVSIRAVFDNPNRLLHSGSTGNVIIPIKYTDKILVPQSAIKHVQTLAQVFRVEGKERKAVAVTIEVSPYFDGKDYIVLSGLNVGDEIIAEGAGMVKEGALVK